MLQLCKVYNAEDALLLICSESRQNACGSRPPGAKDAFLSLVGCREAFFF